MWSERSEDSTAYYLKPHMKKNEILAIALPSIVSNITTPLLGLIDTAIVGHLGSAVLIGAIAVGAGMFNMLYWIFSFLRVGSSGLTAQAFGRGDHRDMSLQLWRALLVGALLGVLLWCLRTPLANLMVLIIRPEENTAALAVDYFRLVVWGAPAVMCNYGIAGWLLGMQDSRTIMWTSIVTNLVNIAVSFSLVYGLGMGLDGVACGTVSAQWAGVLFGLIMGISLHRPHLMPIAEVMEGSKLLQFARINTDVFLRTLCLVAVTMWFTRIGASQSNEILSANAILMQLFLFYSYFTDGFAYAGEALAGKYEGMGDKVKLHQSVRRLAWWSACLAILFCAIYFIAGEWIMHILTDDEGVRRVAGQYLIWVVMVPLVGTTAFMYDGVFVGLTRTRALLASMVVAAVAFFATYYILYPIWHNHALWLAFILYLLLRGGVLYLLYRHQS